MKNRPLTEKLLYALIIILSLAALLLVAASPANFINNALVYKGFWAMESVLLLIGLLFYIAAGRCILLWLRGSLREGLFATLNIAAFYRFCIYQQNDHFNTAFAVYLAVVLLQFATMRIFSEKSGGMAWIAFLTPIAVLVAARYGPMCIPAQWQAALQSKLAFPPAVYLVGISYLAFRSSHLVLEVRNGVVKRPNLCQYLGFCFFVPTVPVGPINPYSNFRRAFEPNPEAIPAGRAAMRTLVGLVKYQFLGNIFYRLTYDGFLRNEHPHHWIDLPVAAVFYYFFLYCNFSGFCDMAIGAAGLMGIPVAENFNDPFAARNVKDFWNRWHITLSLYMRDVVFTPLTKFLARLLGPANTNHAIALAITVVFLLVGIWHGVGWNFAVFGAAHALGVVANHYYTIGLKKWLGRDGFKAYNTNRGIQAAAVILTFCYCAATLFFFANTFPEMKEIFAAMR